jgi:hypothetical protein
MINTATTPRPTEKNEGTAKKEGMGENTKEKAGRDEMKRFRNDTERQKDMSRISRTKTSTKRRKRNKT